MLVPESPSKYAMMYTCSPIYNYLNTQSTSLRTWRKNFILRRQKRGPTGPGALTACAAVTPEHSLETWRRGCIPFPGTITSSRSRLQRTHWFTVDISANIRISRSQQSKNENSPIPAAPLVVILWLLFWNFLFKNVCANDLITVYIFNEAWRADKADLQMSRTMRITMAFSSKMQFSIGMLS